MSKGSDESANTRGKRGLDGRGHRLNFIKRDLTFERSRASAMLMEIRGLWSVYTNFPGLS